MTCLTCVDFYGRDKNIHSNMTSFKRFGSKPVVKYSYIGISADRRRHNLLWLFKYRICPIRIEIIHGGLNIYWFYHGLALYADILPLAIARGKIFGIKGQPGWTRGKISIYSSPHELFLKYAKCTYKPQRSKQIYNREFK